MGKVGRVGSDFRFSETKPVVKLGSALFLYCSPVGDIYQRWSRGHKPRGQGQGHKKIRGQGQGQPFRGTDPLEAKDRNARGQGQGPRRQVQVFSKKKSSKFFSGNLHFIGVPRIFDWGKPKPQITWNDVVKIFPKRKFLWDKDIVGWKIWNRCLLARNQDFAKGEGLN